LVSALANPEVVSKQPIAIAVLKSVDLNIALSVLLLVYVWCDWGDAGIGFSF
jgi:hypothetical protein